MRDDLMVVPCDVRWARDPGLGLKPSLMSSTDWGQVVELGYRDNPEVVLTTTYPEPEDDPPILEIEPDARSACTQAQLEFLGGILERRMKFDEECRENPELTAIALKSYKLSPEALANHIAHLTKLMHGFGQAGAVMLGEINERALRRRRQNRGKR